MAYFHPVRPFYFSDPRVFNSGVIAVVSNRYATSLTLRRHQKRLPLNVTASLVSRPVDCNATYQKSPSLELFAPTACSDRNALLFTPLD
jgi:hypothetical protein